MLIELRNIAVERDGGRYLVRGTDPFYDSPEYHAAHEVRAGVSDFDMLLAEAY